MNVINSNVNLFCACVQNPSIIPVKRVYILIKLQMVGLKVASADSLATFKVFDYNFS